MSACRKRQTKESQDQSSVGLVSTLPNTEPQVCGEVPPVQKDSEVDPRFKSHCTLVTVTAPTALVTWCVHYGILELYNL